ncbi:MAG: ABC transporter substrate-binding protein [Acetatifactor sp.]
MKNIQKQYFGILLTILMLALSGCGSASVTDTKSNGKSGAAENSDLNTATQLRVGDQANYFAAKVALEKGFFEEELGPDVEVTVTSFQGGSVLTEALISNQVDLIMFNDMPSVQAKANNVDVKIISTFYRCADAYSLVAAKNVEVNSAEDLKGLRIAYTAGTQGHKFVLRYLEGQGLTEDDVVLVNLPSADQQAALIAGDVDVIQATNVNQNTIAEAVDGWVLTTSEGYDNTTCFQLVNGTFAEKNPDLIAKYLKALDRANKWINESEENLQEAVRIVSEIGGAEENYNRQYWDTRDFVVTWAPEIEDDINYTIQFLYDQGTISELFDAGELIDLSYLRAAGLY